MHNYFWHTTLYFVSLYVAKPSLARHTAGYYNYLKQLQFCLKQTSSILKANFNLLQANFKQT